MVEDLTDKQRVFVEHYLACWNAAEAARRAGYSADSTRSIGSENLTKPDIRAAIARRLAELAMGADEVLARLSDLARATSARCCGSMPRATSTACVCTRTRRST